MRPRRARAWVAGVVGLAVVVPFVLFVPSGAAAAATSEGVQTAREVQTIWTSEFGEPHPTGVAYLPGRGELLVADVRGGSTSVLRLSMFGDSRGTFRLPGLSSPNTLAFDPSRGRLTSVNGKQLVSAAAAELGNANPSVERTDVSSLGLVDPEGATFDPATGTWFILDAGAQAIVEATGGARPAAIGRISVLGLGDGALRGIAFNPADGLLYVASPDQDLLFALDASGSVASTYDLGSLGLQRPTSMTFASSADTTDAPSTQHLFVTDAGTSSSGGAVMEITLAAQTTLAAPTVTGTLVQVIPTSAWNPASPDPSGVEYLPAVDRLEVCDSEVEEVTGAGYHGVNMWTTTRTGTVTDTGTTYPAFSKEPTGLGYAPGSNTLFISDDSAKRVWVDNTGTDDRFGTSDDVVTSVNASAYGSGDTEDPEYDATTGQPTSGHLFFLDGTNTEIYDVDPVDGVFGNGNDTMTHFDVGYLGPSDWEGLGSNPLTGNLLVGARTTKQIFEITKTGALVRTIDLSALSSTTTLRFISGLQMAPASDGSGRWDIYIVDRNIDNGSNSSENDGRLVEVSVPQSSGDNPPSVGISNPSSGDKLRGTVTVSANASDDHGVTQVQFFRDGTTSLGTDTNGSDGWSAPWNTAAAGDGAHSLTAVATDTVGQTTTSAAVNVTVDNTAPSVSITSPTSGQTVSGTISVQASASDGSGTGVGSVAFLLDGSTVIGTDTNGSDGWSVSWNTTSAVNGAHSLTAMASDVAGNSTTSAAVGVSVNNVDTPPTVAITNPSNDAAVRGQVTVQANAGDDKGVTKVEFFDGATSLGPADTDGSNGWSASWDTTATSEGSHTLTAVATDTVSQTTTSAAVNVTVDNTAPSVSISSPTSGQTVSGTISVQASASDGSGSGIGSVMFLVDGSTVIGTDTNGGDGWSVSWNTATAPNGSHSLTAVAVDAAGNSTASTAVPVTVSNPTSGTLDISVASSSDDAEERVSKGRMILTSGDLDMMLDGTIPQAAVGLRFVGVNIPHGATISNAYVQFQANESESDVTTLSIGGQAIDNAPTFTTTKFNITTRTLTGASVTWTPLPWVKAERGPNERTPQLSSVVQEIVGLAGWSPGNAIVLVIEGSGRRVAEAFDNLKFAPVLHIEWSGP